MLFPDFSNRKAQGTPVAVFWGLLVGFTSVEPDAYSSELSSFIFGLAVSGFSCQQHKCTQRAGLIHI
jgi:hypothetical protein